MAAIRRSDRANEWWIDFRYRRRRVRRRSPVQTKRGAEQYERQLRQEFADDENHGKNPFVEPPKFGEFANRWMREYVRPRNRESVIATKNAVLSGHLLPRFAKLRLSEIRAADISALVESLSSKGLRPKTINNTLSILRTCLTTAQEWELVRVVPRIRWLRVPDHEIRVLSETEAQRLIDVADDPFWKTLLLFILHTGVRFGEVAALRWEHIHLDGSIPSVDIVRGAARGKAGATKTGAHRKMRLSSELRNALERFPRTSDLVFPTASGEVMDPASKAKKLWAFCRRAGIAPIGWHVLRHTFATTMANAGIPLPTLQRMLGHTTIKMTMRYVHVDPLSLVTAGSAIDRALPIRFGHQVDTKPLKAIRRDMALPSVVRSVQSKTDPVGSVCAWSG